MTRREMLLALSSGAAVLGAIVSAFRVSPHVGGAIPSPARRPRLLPWTSAVGSLTEGEKALLWDLAVATGALWGMSDLSSSDLRVFLDLKTQKLPSYLVEYRNALRVLTATGRGPITPHAVEAVLRHPPGAHAEHARQFVIEEFIALHLACGGFHRFGLTRFRGFVGEGYRVSHLQPGRAR
jgi:hypothetical protein